MSLGAYGLGERVLIPAALVALVALMSGGFSRAVGGRTPRMVVVTRCFLLFLAGILYSIAWHDILTAIFFGWEDTWIAVSVLFAAGSFLLGKQILTKRDDEYIEALKRGEDPPQDGDWGAR